VEALKHAAFRIGSEIEILWFDSSLFDSLSQKEIGENLKGVGGIVVPQGWGSRGWKAKLTPFAMPARTICPI